MVESMAGNISSQEGTMEVELASYPNFLSLGTMIECDDVMANTIVTELTQWHNDYLLEVRGVLERVFSLEFVEI